VRSTTFGTTAISRIDPADDPFFAPRAKNWIPRRADGSPARDIARRSRDQRAAAGAARRACTRGASACCTAGQIASAHTS
jgi:hypothetical protein